MIESTMFVGLDVHKESIDVALAPGGQGEVRSYGRIAGDLDAVDKVIRKLRSQHPDLSIAYEAGPCGYALYRHLTRQGIRCAVVAPSMIPKRSGDRIKTDRRDALAIEEAHQRVERITDQIRLAVESWRMAPVAKALQALKGVSLIAGASIVAEVGDLTRFDKSRKLTAFLGLVPSQYSTGAHQRLGSITKTGNSHARRMLVEAAWSYRFPARVARGLCERQEKLPQTVCEIAWRAQLRLCRKYRRLVAKGKIKQVVTTAVARELIGFIWAIAREVTPAAA